MCTGSSQNIYIVSETENFLHDETNKNEEKERFLFVLSQNMITEYKWES